MQYDLKEIKTILSFYYLDTENIEKNLSEFIVAEMNGRIVGCACLDLGDVVELRSIAVLPSCRNRGIGLKLVDTILNRAQALTDIVYLRTTSPVFFEKKGFIRHPHNDKKFIWKDCAQCEKYNICGQTMMEKNICKSH